MSNHISGGSEFVSYAELKKILNKKAANAWHNPVDAKIYSGERVNPTTGELTPTYEVAIFDVAKYKTAEAKRKSGVLDAEEARLNPFIGEYQDIANTYFQTLDASAKGTLSVSDAGVITSTQFADIDTTTVLNRLLNVDIRDFSLPEAVSTQPTDSLEFKFDVFTRFNISQDVPEGVAAHSKRGTVSVTDLDLTKDVGHISGTDEAFMRARQNIRQAHIQNVATDFRRSKSDKIATELETLTEINADDWDSVSSGLSANNPLENIREAQVTIDGNNGKPYVFASHARTWNAFVGNTFVRGAYNRQTEGLEARARVVTIDLLPGVQWYIDNELADNSLIVMDKEAVWLVQGPTRVGQYRMEQEGVDGYVARDWYKVETVQSSKARELATTLS